MTRRAFPTRLEPDLVAALDERVRLEGRSRNWGIEQAVRGWLDRAAADDTPTPRPPGVDHKTRDTARAAGSGTVPGAPPLQPPPDLGLQAENAEHPYEAEDIPPPRHLHRLTVEVPDTRRGVGGVEYATYRCETDGCGKTIERKARD